MFFEVRDSSCLLPLFLMVDVEWDVCRADLLLTYLLTLSGTSPDVPYGVDVTATVLVTEGFVYSNSQ